MAGQPDLFDRNNASLSSAQQDLLLVALHAQADTRQDQIGLPKKGEHIGRSTALHPSASMDGADLFMSPRHAELNNAYDYTPDLDYLDGDNFDFDNADLGGDMIGAMPGEGHEKRKSPDEQDSDDAGDAKRQETQEGEKGAKKPGRKPLTNEPTTKRKAQNRAAQRAFRERKEKHLKDLETKVIDLTKSQEADKHENGMLKAQVERLSIELREYRKRLSLENGAGGLRNSPPLNAQTKSMSASSTGTNNFQFEFPKFGALPGSQIFGNQQNYDHGTNSGILQRGGEISQSPTTIGGGIGGISQQAPSQTRHEDGNRSGMSSKATSLSSNSNAKPNTPSQYISSLPSVGYSNASNMHGFANTLPQMGGDNPFGDLFSPSILRTASTDSSNYFIKNQANSGTETTTGGETTAGLNRVFQFNSGSSASDSASPSTASSNWNGNGANSSCGTSPEPTHDSPANKLDKSFAQPSKLANEQVPDNYNIGSTDNNLDFSVPSSNTFDPVLFGDYRENDQSGGFRNDFNSNFFDEALDQAPYDFGSPSNLFGILQSPQPVNASLDTNAGNGMAPPPSKALMAEIEKARDGGDDDYGLPTQEAKAPQQLTVKDANGKLISCNNIWNQLQANPDFQAGTFDLDSLCSELRAKARCSESGVMVDQNHVDSAFKKLGKKDDQGKFVKATDMPSLMFEQESWDNVLKKLKTDGA